MGEGGSISLLSYNEYVDEIGAPKGHGMDLKPYFTKEYWQRKIPVWQDFMDDWGSLGAPAGTMETRPGDPNNPLPPPPPQSPKGSAQASSYSSNGEGGSGLFTGLLVGVAAYFLYQHREKVIAFVKQLPFFVKDKQ